MPKITHGKLFTLPCAKKKHTTKSLPCVFTVAHGKVALCRVPDKKHTANREAHGILAIFGSGVSHPSTFAPRSPPTTSKRDGIVHASIHLHTCICNSLCKKRLIVTGVISLRWRASHPSHLHRRWLEQKSDGQKPVIYITKRWRAKNTIGDRHQYEPSPMVFLARHLCQHIGDGHHSFMR